ncbi:fungal-specific transcription factor domain-containing protein [Thermoascus aurantiacus ATCC 26904]
MRHIHFIRACRGGSSSCLPPPRPRVFLFQSMEGILSIDLAAAARSPKPKFTRSRTGCLTCRARRKRCGEQKPVCDGCVRNCLLCAWPAAIKPPHQVDGDVRKSRSNRYRANAGRITTTCSSQPYHASQGHLSNRTLSPTAESDAAKLLQLPMTLSSWPNLRHDVRAQEFLQHFLERTAPKLVTVAMPENPFINYLLPLAYRDDKILHAILALSASHRSFNDPAAVSIARNHYAIALRAAKYQVTKVAQGMCHDLLPFLALLLTLAQFEAVDGNMQGAILPHLSAVGTLLSMASDQLTRADETFAGFLLELYAFSSLVATHPGLSTGPPDTDFFDLEMRILVWKPQRLPCTASDVAPMDLLCSAGMPVQLSMLVYLRIALKGPGLPERSLMAQVDEIVDEFMQLIQSIPLDSTSWTSLLWSMLIVGSCLRRTDHRQVLAWTLQNQQH